MRVIKKGNEGNHAQYFHNRGVHKQNCNRSHIAAEKPCRRFVEGAPLVLFHSKRLYYAHSRNRLLKMIIQICGIFSYLAADKSDAFAHHCG